jgi:hypothetical protein
MAIKRHRMSRLAVFLLQAMFAVGAGYRGAVGSHLDDYFNSFLDQYDRFIVTTRAH